MRERFVIEGSRAFGVSYVYTNLLGNEAGRAIYDGGGLVATAGRLVANGPRFTFGERQLTTAVVDLDVTRMSQARLWSFSPELEERPGTRVRDGFTFPAAEEEPGGSALPPGSTRRGSRKRSSRAPSRWGSSTTSARAPPAASWSRSRVAPTRRRCRAWWA